MTPMTPPDMTPSAIPDRSGFVSQAQAAKMCAVSAATIRRARVAGKLEGVEDDGKGGWLIPVRELVRVGMLAKVSPPDTPSTEEAPRGMTPPMASPVPSTDEEVRVLRDQLDRERSARIQAEADLKVARAVVDAQESNLSDLRSALRMLEAGPATREVVEPEPAPVEPEVQNSRPQGWWGRLFDSKFR